MHGIDVGQPALCRGIDCLSLISSHSLLARSRNDELRQISDTGAPVWSCVNPPSLRCSRSWGGTPRTTAHHRCLAALWLMHSSVLFLFVLMTSVSLVGIWWLFANTADASAYTCHFLRPTPLLVSADYHKSQFFSEIAGLSVTAQRDIWHIFHWRRKSPHAVEEMSIDEISMEGHVFIADRAIIKAIVMPWAAKPTLYLRLTLSFISYLPQLYMSWGGFTT